MNPKPRTIPLGWKDEASDSEHPKQNQDAAQPHHPRFPPSRAPSSAQFPHIQQTALDFKYSDRQSFADELDEFFSELDVSLRISAQEHFDMEYSSAAGTNWWLDNDSLKEGFVINLLDQLESRDIVTRIRMEKALFHITLGCVGDLLPPKGADQVFQSIKSNNRLLFRGNAFTYYRNALKHVSSILEAIVSAGSASSSIVNTYRLQQLSLEERQTLTEMCHLETTLLLSIIYVGLDSIGQDSPGDIHEILWECDEEVEFSKNTTPINSSSTSSAAKTDQSNAGGGNIGYLKVKKGQVPFALDLFEMISIISEATRKAYPVKKLVMLLWIVLLYMGGDTKSLQNLKQETRAREGLEPTRTNKESKNTIKTKATPQDWHAWHLLISKKYPMYYVEGVEALWKQKLLFADPISGVTRRAIMQPFYSSAFVGGLGQGHFSTGPASAQQNQIGRDYIVMERLPDGNLLPKAMEEAQDILKSQMYISAKDIQISREIHELEFMKRRAAAAMVLEGAMGNASGSASGASVFGFSSSANNKKFPRVGEKDGSVFPNLIKAEKLYRFLSPNLTIHMGMLIRLLYYVNLGNELQSKSESQSSSSFDDSTELNSTNRGKNVGSLDDSPRRDLLDPQQHREVVTKAISGVLLMILNIVKCDDILKFEYISQLLVDNNCTILILKMLSIWFPNPLQATQASPVNVSAPVSTNSDKNDAVGLVPMSGMSFLKARTEFSFFQNLTYQVQPDSSGAESTDSEGLQKACWRNLYTIVCLLRILQKLTKKKTHRILSLVQWKSSAVLKRIVKISCIDSQKYSLKLLKSQVPFLGKKWRSTNMKTITMIYQTLRPNLVEEYLSGDADGDAEEALAQEQFLRSLIACYHHRVYPDIFPPPAQAPNESTSAAPGNLGAHARKESVKHLGGGVVVETDELETMLANGLSVGGTGGSTVPRSMGRNRYLDMAIGHGGVSNELDENFKASYQMWAESEVFSGFVDELREGVDDDCDVAEGNGGGQEGRPQDKKRVIVDEFDDF